jgi:prevent-host-death family protein
MRSIAAEDFETQCLALLDEIADTGETLIVTKRGKPVAKVVPAAEPRTLVGSAQQLVSDEELIKPLYEDWEPDPSGLTLYSTARAEDARPLRLPTVQSARLS